MIKLGNCTNFLNKLATKPHKMSLMNKNVVIIDIIVMIYEAYLMLKSMRKDSSMELLSTTIAVEVLIVKKLCISCD